MQNCRWLLFLMLSMTLWGTEPDQVTLKSGEKITGLIVDTKETPDAITINLSLARGISDFKQIPKSDIETITRPTGEKEVAHQLVLGEKSVEAKWYEEAIEKQIKPWLVRFAKSPLAPDMEAKRQAFQSELDQVKKGNRRVGSRWFTQAEYEAEKPEFEAADVLTKIKEAATRSDYFVLSDLLHQSFDQYSKTRAFPKIVVAGKKALENPDPEKIKSAAEQALKAHQKNYDDTVRLVQQIVNQPVRTLPRTAEASEYSPGWFDNHIGKPNFSSTDVTQSQDLIYHGYVTSNLNPNVMYQGEDLEFNSKLKYFYTDLSVPKKKLTLAEMQEINRLYRILSGEEYSLAQTRSKIGELPGFIDDLKMLNAQLASVEVKP